MSVRESIEMTGKTMDRSERKLSLGQTIHGLISGPYTAISRSIINIETWIDRF